MAETEPVNIFKGLSFQQKKALLTNSNLKTDKDFKEFGKTLAETLNNEVDSFGVAEVVYELLAL